MGEARNLNTRIELHRHLDVSVRLPTLLELAQKKGIVPESTSIEAFRKRFILTEPLKDLGAVLANFDLFPRVLDRPEILERAAFEACEDVWNEGTHNVEYRFSPHFVCMYSNLRWLDALDAFEAGINRAREVFPGFHVGLICIGSRDFGMESIEKTVEFYLTHKNRFIGLDIAGDEPQFPNAQYASLFRPLLDENLPITIHAGEAAGPESVWAAVELLGAKRIGHGVRSIDDPKLMEMLRDRKILLEMCPTSNRITSAWPDLRTHPLKRFLEFGIPVSINTDDPGIFNITLGDEVEIAKRQIGLSNEQIAKTFRYAHEHSFLK